MSDPGSRTMNPTERILEEIKKINLSITDLKKTMPKDDTPSEACLIMVMKLEVAFLLVNKMFSTGMFDSTVVYKQDLTGNAGRQEKEDK